MQQRDRIFKIGLGLQLFLIPLALFWRFSQDTQLYYWVLSSLFVITTACLFWPQPHTNRAKRLSLIYLQLKVLTVVLIVSWLLYLYFHHFVESHGPGLVLHAAYWERLFNNRLTMTLGAGISPSTAIVLTFAIVSLTVGNLQRYKPDRTRGHDAA